MWTSANMPSKSLVFSLTDAMPANIRDYAPENGQRYYQSAELILDYIINLPLT